MNKLGLSAALLMIAFSQMVSAETVSLRCFYTEVTYDAPFMAEPAVRQCPEQRCYYDMNWDTDSGVAQINGQPYELSLKGQRAVLTREVPNPIMGGVDKATFSVDTETWEFRAIRLTNPEVKLQLAGQCESMSH